MTERLREILNRKPSKWGNLTVKEFERDIKLLQERVQELERNLEHGAKVAVKTAEKLYFEQQKNKRYREVLEFYADERNYEERHFGIIVQSAIHEGDRGNTARKALEGEK